MPAPVPVPMPVPVPVSIAFVRALSLAIYEMHMFSLMRAVVCRSWQTKAIRYGHKTYVVALQWIHFMYCTESVYTCI